LLNDYDAIGFSVDHCLVKYNVKALTKELVKTHLLELHNQFGYPEEICDFDWENNLGVCLNCAVWDIEHGTVLRLAEGKIVTHAVHGFQPLSGE